MKNNTHLWSYLPHFLLEWNIFHTEVTEKSKHTFYVQYFFFFRKSCRLWDNVGKYCAAGQAAYDSTVHAYCMMDSLQTDTQNM